MSARREPMSAKKTKVADSKTRLLLAAMLVVAFLVTTSAYGAAPGITGPTFNLTAQAANITQPDGGMIYSWGYGCASTYTASFLPITITPPAGGCPTMQVPGPTLIVTEGQTVTVNLLNGLPTSAGNTSILFPGFNVKATGGVTGLLTQEAAPGGGTVTYTFTAGSPGTRAYYSGTQSDLQVEMGMYGAIIVLPSATPAACTTGPATAGGSLRFAGANGTAESFWTERDFRLAAAAYDNAKTCYDREYLFQFSEIDPNIHNQAMAQVLAKTGCVAANPACRLEVPTEPY